MEGGRGKHCSKQPVCVCIGRGCKGGHLTVTYSKIFFGRQIFAVFTIHSHSIKFCTYEIFTMCTQKQKMGNSLSGECVGGAHDVMLTLEGRLEVAKGFWLD